MPDPELIGKVALVTGAARGQGRNHCVRLAEAGADIIAVDVCADVDGIDYPLGTEAELERTAAEVRAAGRRAHAGVADVRDRAAMARVVGDGVALLGRLDVVVANAGVGSQQTWNEVTPAKWEAVLDTNLTGAWNSVTVCLDHLIASGGGSVICIGSTGAVKGLPFMTAYVAAKHGLVGLAKSLANELAAQDVRVNVIHPTGVRSPMVEHLDALPGLIAAAPETGPVFTNALPIRLVEPDDVSHAVLYLASDRARYVTGAELKVDAGNTLR